MRAIPQLLTTCRSLAVVGLSPKADRTSHAVAAYMQQHGWRIIPVNPQAAGQAILGETCYASLREAAADLAAKRETIDIVNVFRKSEDVPPVLAETLAIQAQAKVQGFWLQLGISHAESEKRAAEAGLSVVANRCIKVELACLPTT
jgi:hypothetical protein